MTFTKIAVTLAAGTIALAGCGGTSTISTTGTMTVADLSGGIDHCYPGVGYSDITEGASVTIYDQRGSVIGTSALEAGVSDPTGCTFSFRITKLPAKPFYSVEVAHHGRVTFSQAEMKAGPGMGIS